MSKYILKIEKLLKYFDGHPRINDLSFEVELNSIVLITGENGAGKTTLFNLITGMEMPDSGRILFNNEDITTKSILNRSRLGITRLYQKPRMFNNLKVWENLILASNKYYKENIFKPFLSPFKSKKVDEELKINAINMLNEVGLNEYANKYVRELSFGQQKIISFCMVLINNPKLILLDEPFSGLNPINIKLIKNMIDSRRSNDVSFIIIEHNIEEAFNICDWHFVIDKGTFINKTRNV